MTLWTAGILAAIAGAIATIAELWHARRVKRVDGLVFGPRGTPPLWWISIPVRVLGLTAFVWGMAVLLALAPRRTNVDTTPAEKDFHRLLVVLDVSPSMHLPDAGPKGNQPRATRAGDVMLDVIGRLALGECKATVVAFYSEAKPVAVDVVDLAVLENIFRDLPLDQAFNPGPSELFKGLTTAFELADKWPAGTTTLVVVSDGDVPPASGMPAKPISIGDVLVVGVGNTNKTSFVGGHGSRQDASALTQIANRLGGQYVDCNLAPLPPTALKKLTSALPEKDAPQRGLRELAILAAGIGGILLAGVPVGLGLLATLRKEKITLKQATTAAVQE